MSSPSSDFQDESRCFDVMFCVAPKTNTNEVKFLAEEEILFQADHSII